MKYIKNKKGNSSIIMLLMITVLLGIMSFSVDAGLLYYEKGKLQSAVDSAALAAVSVFEEGETKMLEEAYKYAALNNVDPVDMTVSISENRRSVTVSTQKTVSLYFAKIFGVSNAEVKAGAGAAAGPISSTKGVRPFAVENQEFVYGQPYTLKEGGGDGSTGNYGSVGLGDTGASNYRNVLINGYSDRLSIGDEIETEPGNMSGPTLDGLKSIMESDLNEHSEDLSKLEVNCPRLIKIPIVNSMDVDGRSTVTVVGFAAFFLDSIEEESGQTEITGRFVKTIDEGEIDQSAEDCGLFGVKLVE